MGHVRPAGEEEIVGARRPLLARGGDLEVLDIELDAHLAEHRRDGLADLELLGIEVLHQDDIDGDIRVAGLLEIRRALSGS